MKILGIRTSINAVRYAILSDNSGTISWMNHSDNRLVYPRDMHEIENKIVWLSEQIRRILVQENNIDKIIIKIPEYGRNDTAPNRASDYLDAVIILEATARDIVIPVELKNYRAINTRSNEVMQYAETHIGRTEHYWDALMADSLAAAYSGFDHEGERI